MRANRRPETSEPLRFPVPSAPLRAHPAPTVDMILAASEAMLPAWNADPRREARRLAGKCRVRFVLREDPAPPCASADGLET